MSGWISVVGWRKFQHYDPTKRRPLWIKNYTDLTRRDDYRDLGASERAILHGIWLEYASSQCTLKFSPSSLTSRLNLRVRKQHLETLVQAGFIEEVASKTLANGYQLASPEVEVEEEKEPPTPTVVEGPPADPPEPLPDLDRVLRSIPA